MEPAPAGFAFSADPRQQFLYVVDSGPMRVVFDRESMTQIGAFGIGGLKPGDFDVVDYMAADSKRQPVYSGHRHQPPGAALVLRAVR